MGRGSIPGPWRRRHHSGEAGSAVENSSKAPISTNSSAGTEWTVRSRYETTDGDRVTLLISPSGDRFVVSYSYAWGHAPQFIEYTERSRAFDTFVFSYTAAEARGVVAHREG